MHESGAYLLLPMHSTEALPQAQQRYTGQIRPVKGIITLCRLCCVLREYNEISGSISCKRLTHLSHRRDFSPAYMLKFG